MREAAKAFDFEKAIRLRDRIKALKTRDLMGVAETSS
jgi:excinuclease UvrABC helicase subunit UvrB